MSSNAAKKTTSKTAAKPAKAKAAPKKAAAKPAAKKVGATKAAAKLAAAPKAKSTPALPVGQDIADETLQAIADERSAIVTELSEAKGKVNEIDSKLKEKNQELLDNGATVGMIFANSDGDSVQFTHNATPSTSYSKVIAAFLDKHDEFTDEFEKLKAEFTSENQQQPNFKAA